MSRNREEIMFSLIFFSPVFRLSRVNMGIWGHKTVPIVFYCLVPLSLVPLFSNRTYCFSNRPYCSQTVPIVCQTVPIVLKSLLLSFKTFLCCEWMSHRIFWKIVLTCVVMVNDEGARQSLANSSTMMSINYADVIKCFHTDPFPVPARCPNMVKI